MDNYSSDGGLKTHQGGEPSLTTPSFEDTASGTGPDAFNDDYDDDEVTLFSSSDYQRDEIQYLRGVFQKPKRFAASSKMVFDFVSQIQSLQGDLLMKQLKKHDDLLKLVIHVSYFIHDVVSGAQTMLSAASRFLLTFFSPHSLARLVQIICKPLLSFRAQSKTQFLDGALDIWEGMRESEFIHNAHRVLVGLVTAVLAHFSDFEFSEEGYMKFFMCSNVKKFSSLQDLMFNTLKVLRDFVNIGHECFAERSLQPLIIRNREVRSWLVQYQEVSEFYERLPMCESYSREDLVTTFDTLIAKGNLLCSKGAGREISVFLKALSTQRSQFVKANNVCAYRDVPFSVLLYGSPGIGKSLLTDILAALYQQAVTTPDENNVIYDPDLKWIKEEHSYTRSPVEDFWSGYQGAKQWLVIMDDLARETAYVARQGKSSVLELISVVNSVGMASNQAAIEDKGAIPIKPKMVVVTSNNKQLNAGQVSDNPAALLRRVPIVITPSVKKEHWDYTNGCIREEESINPNIWEFTVERYLPHNNSYDVIMENASMSELQPFLVKEIRLHLRRQRKVAQGFKALDTTLCPHNIMKMIPCDLCGSQIEAQTSHVETGKDMIFGAYNKLASTARSWLPSYAMPIDKVEDKFLTSRYASTFRRYIIKSIIKQAEEDIQKLIPKWAAFALKISAFATLLGTLQFAYTYHKKTRQYSAQADIWRRTESNEQFVPPKSSKRGNTSELESTISRSGFTIFVQSGQQLRAQAYCIQHGYYLTVSHLFPKSEGIWQCVMQLASGVANATGRRAVTLNESNLIRLPNDLVLIKSKQLHPRRALYKFLPDKPDLAHRYGYQYLNGERLDVKVLEGNHPISYRSPDGQMEINSVVAKGERAMGAPPQQGDCGSLFVVNHIMGDFISGMHVAGNPHTMNVCFSRLSKEMFKDVMFEPMAGPGNIEHLRNGSVSSKELTSPYRKGIHYWIPPDSQCEMLGSYPGRHTPSSKLTNTVIREQVEEQFGKSPYGKPVMAPQERNGVWVNPYTIAATQQSHISCHFIEEKLDKCVENFLERIPQVLPDLREVTQEVAVNGLPQVDYIHRIPMSTSGGFFFPGPKRNYMEEISENVFEVVEEVQEHIDRIEADYVLGHRANVIFQGTLKDEPMSYKKIESGKTRVFTACDMAFSIVLRRQYLRVVKFIMENNFVFECAVGMNHYADWPKLYQYLTAFGKNRLIAGDYSSFDKSMPAIMIVKAFEILNTLIDRVCSTEKSKMIRTRIPVDIAFPIVNMNGDVFQFYGGNSSGHPLTSVLNSLVNSLYMRYAYLEIHGRLDDFNQRVNLMTYGDDNILTTDLDTFGHTSIQDQLGKLGITYTMADKESETRPFINIVECDFLKRTFREVRGVVRGPLALKSIIRSVCMYIPKGNISSEQQLAESVVSAIRELVLHDRQVFERYTEFLISVLREHHPKVFNLVHSSAFNTFDEWLDDFDQHLVTPYSSEEELGVYGSSNLRQIGHPHSGQEEPLCEGRAPEGTYGMDPSVNKTSDRETGGRASAPL